MLCVLVTTPLSDRDDHFLSPPNSLFPSRAHYLALNRFLELHVLLQQPPNEVSPEEGDLFLAGIIETFSWVGHWRQPFCDRRAPAHFPARETKISKTASWWHP